MIEALILAGKGASAIAALGGAGWGVYRYGVRPVVGLWREVCDVHEIIRRELTPNGGGSMRDSLTRIELRMIASEARSRAALVHMGVAFWESDASGDCTYASRDLCSLTDRTPDQIKGRGWVSMVAPEDRDAVVAEWDAAVGDAREFSMEFAYVLPAGERVRVRAHAIVMREKGQVLGFLGVAHRVGVGS